ncbi:MAG: hypothetical protein ACO1OI_05430 [Hydrogenophaga sp.]
MSKIALAWLAMAACGAQALAAQEVPVGRVDVRLPGEGWEVHSVENKKIAISGRGYTHDQSYEYKVIVRRGPDRLLDAVLLVRANASGLVGFSGVEFSGAGCTAPARAYAEGDKAGAAARSFRCLRVTPLQRSTALSVFPEDIRSVLSKLDLRLPRTMFGVAAAQYATTGSFATVEAYVRSLAKAPEVENTPANAEASRLGIEATSFQWARQLQEAVSDSVYSIRGKLIVPALNFADEAREPAHLPAQPKIEAPPMRTPASPFAEMG